MFIAKRSIFKTSLCTKSETDSLFWSINLVWFLQSSNPHKKWWNSWFFVRELIHLRPSLSWEKNIIHFFHILLLISAEKGIVIATWERKNTGNICARFATRRRHHKTVDMLEKFKKRRRNPVGYNCSYFRQTFHGRFKNPLEKCGYFERQNQHLITKGQM